MPSSPSPSPYHAIVDPGDPEDADDERSFSDIEHDPSGSPLPGQRNHPGQLTPRFPGQDVRPTSRKELLGWYSYAWAAEVFVVCGVGSFIPVTLEQLARENGVLLSDHTTPCGAASRAIAGGSSLEITDSNDQCVVSILGWHMNTASFAMYDLFHSSGATS
jgi:UMF1 family MFS transporter